MATTLSIPHHHLLQVKPLCGLHCPLQYNASLVFTVHIPTYLCPNGTPQSFFQRVHPATFQWPGRAPTVRPRSVEKQK